MLAVLFYITKDGPNLHCQRTQMPQVHDALAVNAILDKPGRLEAPI